MKRRLNIAAGLVHKPELLVLDEPTVGVDPQSRNHIFDTVRALRDKGMTVVYTSHYMEEVEALCDRVAIMDHGEIAALGTVGELVEKHAGRGVEIEIAGELEAAARAAEAHGAVTRSGTVLRIVPTAQLAPVIAAIEASGARIAKIESRQANLETAFLALTGRALRELGPAQAVERAEVLEVLIRGELFVEREILRDEPELLLRGARLLRERHAADRHRPARRRHDAAHHRDRRRLAGAVRAEQAEDLALHDVEIERLDRSPLAVVLAEAA